MLPLRAFSYTKTGLRSCCRACRAAERARQRPARTRRVGKNPITNKCRHLKYTAHNRGPSDIDIDWIMERLDRGVCELTGIPFVYKVRHPFLPSIDRIDATQPGHMKDNCRIVLWGLNAFKGTASEEVFLQCLEAVSAAPNKS